MALSFSEIIARARTHEWWGSRTVDMREERDKPPKQTIQRVRRESRKDSVAFVGTGTRK